MIKLYLNSIEKVKKFVSITMKQKSEIFITSGKFVVDGKSILGLFSLDLSQPLEMKIIENIKGESNEFIKELDDLGFIYN